MPNNSYSFSYNNAYDSSPYIRKKQKSSIKISLTLILIIITAAIFLIQVIVDYVTIDKVTGFGAFTRLFSVIPSKILAGQQLWTLITSVFLHGSVWHLLMNMISLMFIGSFLEKIIGKKRFIWLYLIAGVMGSVFYVLSAVIFHQNLDMPALGASGAIFGVAAVLAVLTPKVPVYLMFIPIAMPLWLGVLIMLVGVWLLSAAVGLPIGNFAHLGGLIVGLIFGFYLRFKHKKKVKMLDRHFSK